MKKSLCHHFPKNPARPQADHCQGGEPGSRFGLRVCLTCGYVGCCEDDPGQHAKKHMEETGHKVIAYFPAEENSPIWCYEHNHYLEP